MRNILSEHLKRMATIILAAGFEDVVIDAWEKANEDPEAFIKLIKPYLKRHERDLPLAIEQLKKDVFEGTDKKVKLVKTIDEFKAVPVGAPVH